MNYRIKALLGAVICLVGITACATPMQSGSQCVAEPGFFDQRNSYHWRDPSAIKVNDETGFVSPLVARALHNTLTAELAKKGFFEAPTEQEAALGLAVTLNTRRELQSFVSEDGACEDCWESVNPGSSTRMTLRTVGFLALDVYADGEPVWRGWVERNLYPDDRDKPQQVLTEAIPRLLENFPPKD